MSYILEALRRAETERERKRRVPGLHAQPVPVLPPEEQRPPRSKGWLWLALGLAAGLLVAVLWHGWSGDAADDDALARSAATGSVMPGAHVPAEAPPQPPVAAVPAPAANEAPPAHAAAPAAPPEPAPAHRAATVAKARARPQPQGPPGASTEPAAARRAEARHAKPAAAPAPAVAAVASAPEPHVRTLAELPTDLQRAVPALSFGGSVYSEVPAQRIVILNGQVLREGDMVSDDVQLEQIRAHSAVLRVRGQRFEMPF